MHETFHRVIKLSPGCNQEPVIFYSQFQISRKPLDTNVQNVNIMHAIMQYSKFYSNHHHMHSYVLLKENQNNVTNQHNSTCSIRFTRGIDSSKRRDHQRCGARCYRPQTLAWLQWNNCWARTVGPGERVLARLKGSSTENGRGT